MTRATALGWLSPRCLAAAGCGRDGRCAVKLATLRRSSRSDGPLPNPKPSWILAPIPPFIFSGNLAEVVCCSACGNFRLGLVLL